MTDPSHSQTGNRFLTLDGMRGLAALVVVVWHTGATRFLQGGYLAVDLFFVLSGFVLAHAYSDRAIGVGTFMKARVLRLYPLYALGLILGSTMALVWGRFGSTEWPNFALNAAFLPAAQPTQGRYIPYPFNGPSWSLFFELLINAAWFPLRRYLTDRIVAGLLIVGAILVVGLVAAAGSLDVGSQGLYFVPQGFIRVFYSFLAGVAVYKLSRRKPARRTLHPLICMAALVLILSAPLPRVLIDPLAVLVLFPALVYLSAGVEPSVRLRPIFFRLGIVSYAVYCLHSPMIALASSVFGNEAQPRDWVAATMPSAVTDHLGYVIAVVCLPAVVLLALAADRWFDTPVRTWLTRRLVTADAKLAAR